MTQLSDQELSAKWADHYRNKLAELKRRQAGYLQPPEVKMVAKEIEHCNERLKYYCQQEKK